MVIKRIFDERNILWDKEVGYNYHLLTSKLTFYNNRLDFHEYVFLKDIFNDLCMEISRESCTVGWVKGLDDHISMKITQIKGTSNFELTFECRSILESFITEDEVQK